MTLPGSKTAFGVPANLHVIGTMNTADRSIALLDTALRRRFVFEEMMPDASHPGVGTNVDGVDCRQLLAAMNRRIAILLDREHQIGHTYFLGVDTLAALASTFRTRIMPLLQEYFYDDWEKIRAVLNDNGFVRKSDPPEELVRAESGRCRPGRVTTCRPPMTGGGPPRLRTGRSTRGQRKTAARRRAPDHVDSARAAGSRARASDGIA